METDGAFPPKVRTPRFLYGFFMIANGRINIPTL
jgi:hypothetical protein